jgi:hypothetical protein
VARQRGQVTWTIAPMEAQTTRRSQYGQRTPNNGTVGVFFMVSGHSAGNKPRNRGWGGGWRRSRSRCPAWWQEEREFTSLPPFEVLVCGEEFQVDGLLDGRTDDIGQVVRRERLELAGLGVSPSVGV